MAPPARWRRGGASEDLRYSQGEHGVDTEQIQREMKATRASIDRKLDALSANHVTIAR